MQITQQLEASIIIPALCGGISSCRRPVTTVASHACSTPWRSVPAPRRV